MRFSNSSKLIFLPGRLEKNVYNLEQGSAKRGRSTPKGSMRPSEGVDERPKIGRTNDFLIQADRNIFGIHVSLINVLLRV